MSIIAKLYVEGQVFNVLKCEHGFKQVTDISGRPSGKPFHVGLVVVIEATSDTYFFEKAIHPTETVQEIILEYAHSFLSGKSRKIRFLDCHVIANSTYFKATGNQPLTDTLEITAAAIEDLNSQAKYRTYRQVTPFKSDEISPMIADTTLPTSINS